VAREATAAPWFQLYMLRDRGFMETLIARADAAGCPVMLFTVDLPIAGWRRRDVRNAMIPTTPAQRLRQVLDGLAHPAWLWDVMARGGPHVLGNLTAAGAGLEQLADYWAWLGPNTDAAITWDDIAWVRERWRRQLVIKGVLEVEDARQAVRSGADGIVVSNHGGRQLDGAKPTIEALARIAQAVGDETVVLMDGGVRSGLDVLKALASGARACLIGRAWAFALAARGEAGVTAQLETLRHELRVAMALTGCADVAQASPDLLS
jgi:L-lactate dehydrogenase (cytochrome)